MKSVTVIIVMKKSLSKMAVKKIFIVPRILAAQKKHVFFESVASILNHLIAADLISVKQPSSFQTKLTYRGR